MENHNFLMGKTTISMAIFSIAMLVYQRVYPIHIPLNPYKIPLTHYKLYKSPFIVGFPSYKMVIFHSFWYVYQTGRPSHKDHRHSPHQRAHGTGEAAQQEPDFLAEKNPGAF